MNIKKKRATSSKDTDHYGTAPSSSSSESSKGISAISPESAANAVPSDKSEVQLVERDGDVHKTSMIDWYLELDEADRLELAKELRESINGSLLNVGVLAALMMALAGAIYTDPPDLGECHGEAGLHAQMVITWMAMGFFFFSTISTVVLYMDIDGVPTHLLLNHLYSGRVLFCLPHLATALGIFMTAIAYAIDIGERGGCPFFYFGIVAAPCFVFAIVALWFLCRWRRQTLFRELTGGDKNKGRRYQVSYLATWSDRVPVKDEVLSG